MLGLLTGSIAGLATITPCAGYVSPWAAMIIGFLAGLVCYVAIWYKNKKNWDDALDVWGVHGVGGILGTVLLGVFATTAVNAAGAHGLIDGSSTFFGVQVIAVILASIWAFVFTYVMLFIIDKVTRVRVSESVEKNGLDFGLHGEIAYLEDTIGGEDSQKTDLG
jgi:Amt family ammonium transporter